MLKLALELQHSKQTQKKPEHYLKCREYSKNREESCFLGDFEGWEEPSIYRIGGVAIWEKNESWHLISTLIREIKSSSYKTNLNQPI